MKKIYSIIFAAAAIFAASSCQEEIVEPDLGTQENESMTITAGFGAETKTVLDGLKTYWKKGDQISVFDYDHDANSRRFSIDETATTFEDGKAASATFKYDGEFVWPQNDQPDPLIVALYPYQENAFCSFFIPDKNDITGFAIPTEQVALEGGFDDRATFALATSKYSERDNLTFTNLYSLLRITINEDGVKEVKVTVEGENIAGEAKVQLNLEMEDENTPVFNGGTLSVTEKGTNVVTLTCDGGFKAGKDYYIAIAPVTYTNIKVYLDDVLVKDTTPAQPKALLPNTIYNIKDLQNPEDRGLSFPQDEYSVFLGNDFTAPELSGETTGVTYSSSNEEVATVNSETGAVTVKAVGTTVITATAPQTTEYNEATATYTLVVSEKEDRTISFTVDSKTVTYGENVELPELNDVTDDDIITYASNDETIATVDNDGKINIIKAGTVEITATVAETDTYKECSATYTLTVNKAARTLTFSAATATATLGKSFTPPTLSGTPDITGVKYNSSNTDVATVDENTGDVMLVGAGETTITASVSETDTYVSAVATYILQVELLKIYLKPNAVWKSADARFAARVWYDDNQPDLWVDMSDSDGDGIYEAGISAKYTKVIFCRMNPGTNLNDWSNTWGQTNDLIVTEDKVYTINREGWKDGSWETYDEAKNYKEGFDLYFVPNNNWKSANPRFAAYFFGNGDKWVSMTKIDDSLYGVDKPSDKQYPSVIFVRMNPGNSTNDWNNKWTQTEDLTIPTNANNKFTINDDASTDGGTKSNGFWGSL